jgi:hypothetical protein
MFLWRQEIGDHLEHDPERLFTVRASLHADDGREDPVAERAERIELLARIAVQGDYGLVIEAV